MNDNGSRSASGRRGLAAGATALAGVALLMWAFLQPANGAVPGWSPVNGQVAEALAGSASAEPTPQASAGTDAAAATPASDSGTSAVDAVSAAAAPSAGQAAAPLPGSPGAEANSGAASAGTAAAAPAAAPVAVPVAAPDNRLDLNSATAEQLDSLKGIGPSKAQAIVAYRAEHGAFRSVEELLKVNGIGEKLLAGLRDQVRV
ncbi:ComEA family DNA-binding protein [Cohnella fermenti]|uniref:Helix-hairpin-helix domain-containing protein n=1 Tax=Cohnella fermenti TaxID=2565925 RepID=A0A4S4BKJ7_9BACL|nr:ComEA family DNA-binding protein [Cohnella fermenti]THF75025.1 helix-hairpin-helix domain-containing protein [Cohnella fermenti]